MTTAQFVEKSRSALISIDRVWLFTAAVFAVLVVAMPNQAALSAGKVIESLIGIAPYLLLAVVATGYASATNADHLISKAFKGKAAFAIITAALFGALSPFCSCGVIPLIAALLAMGVPLAPVMAFWLASPIMDPTMFVITAGELGMDFAVAKTVFAVMIGLMGGYVVHLLSGGGYLADPLREGVGDGGCGGSRVRAPKPVLWTFWQEEDRRAKFRTEALKSFLFLVKWLTLAYLLESLFLAWIPAENIAQYLGSGEGWMIAVAGVVGAPLYLNGYAAVPVASGLIGAGMAPGAAMAFLIGGGITSIPAAIAVYALAKRPVFVLYILFAFTGAAISGMLYQLWV